MYSIVQIKVYGEIVMFDKLQEKYGGDEFYA